MLRVLVHIQGRLDEELSLGELARIAHFSPYHFHRVFRGMVGETVKEHVRRLRLERAVQRLTTTRHSIARIAFEAGYESHESFLRAFRAMFKVNPSQLRKNHRSPATVAAPSGVHFTPSGAVRQFQPIDTGGSNMEARIERIDRKRVAFVRHVGPYDQCGAAWGKLCEWAGRNGLLGPNTRMLGICHDDPEVTPSDKIRYDACVVVDESIHPGGDVGIQYLEGGEYATAQLKGPYSGLAALYGRLCGEWIPAQRREIRSAPCFEIYHNDPNRTKPEDLITDVHVPLEDKGFS
jgi:AraC family transcriptional regulator